MIDLQSWKEFFFVSIVNKYIYANNFKNLIEISSHYKKFVYCHFL